MESLITIATKSVISLINAENRSGSFQLFGYDFMIDSKGETWLIEVNNNPCLEESSSILKEYIPRMLDDAFKITVDRLLKPISELKNTHFHVANYPDDVNLWKRVFL